MKLTKLLIGVAVSAGAILPQIGVADSQLSFGGLGTTAQANLDFRITIPEFVFFQIGSAGATVDEVAYDLSATQPGSGGPFAATGGTGDGADGVLTVTLITNAANVSIGASGGNLTSGIDNLPFADITASDGGVIAVPDFGATVTPLAIGAISQVDSWTYTYDNTTAYVQGI